MRTDTGEKVVATSLMFVREKDKVDFDLDEHLLTLLDVDFVKTSMRDAGFEPYLYADFSGPWDERTMCNVMTFAGKKTS